MIVGYTEDYSNLDQEIVLIWDLIPSEHYIEYEIGATGTEYTAPESGYVVVLYDNKKSKNTSFSIVVGDDDILSSSMEINSDSGYSSVLLPIVKGYTFKVNYSKTAPKWIRLFKAIDFMKTED